MKGYTIEETQAWVAAFDDAYIKYMLTNHIEIYNRFISNIHPPREIGGYVMISKLRIQNIIYNKLIGSLEPSFNSGDDNIG